MVTARPDTQSGARSRLLGFRVTARWLARWKRELARIRSDTGISAERLTPILLDVLMAALPEIRRRAVAAIRPDDVGSSDDRSLVNL